MLFARRSVLSSDEAASKAVWQWKGASGSKRCQYCKNVTLELSGLHLGSRYFISNYSSDSGKLQLWEHAEVVEAQARLEYEYPRASKAAFNTMEQNIGWNWATFSSLTDRTTRLMIQPLAATMCDLMHCYFVHGIFNKEVGQFVSVIRGVGVLVPSIHDYFKGWRWPSRVESKAATGRTVFCNKRWPSNDDALKASASECLNIYGIIRDYVASMLCNGSCMCGQLQQSVRCSGCVASCRAGRCQT